MNRASSSRNAPVNRFDFSAPVPSPLQAPRFIQSNSIPITQPDTNDKNQNSKHNHRHRFSKSQRAPRRQGGLSMTQEVMPYGRKPPKPPREESTSPRVSARSHRRNYNGSPTESRRGLAAAQPIREYMIHFERLVSMTEDYIRTNPTYGSYVGDVKSLKDAYDVFVLQGSLHFSTSNPDDDPRPTIKTTPIYKSAKNLLNAWAKYIESTNAIESEGLAPHLDKINDSFNQINSTIKNMRRAMPNIRYRTDVSCVSLETFQGHISALREEVSEQFLAPKELRFKQFDGARFQQQITFLTRQIFEIYAHSLPNSCLPLARKIQTRTELSTAIANISSAVLAARKCDEVFNSMKGEIILANQRLTSIFQRMNFPFSVSLIFDDDKIVQTNQNKNNDIKSFSLHANTNANENVNNENNANADENANTEENPNTEESANAEVNVNAEENANTEVNTNTEENANTEENTNASENANTEENANNENNANTEENTNASENTNNDENLNTEENVNNENNENNANTEENANAEANVNAEKNANNDENPNTEENVNNENNANAEENTNASENANNGENPNTEENVNNENNANAEENTNASENANNGENPNTEENVNNENNENNANAEENTNASENANNGENPNTEENVNNENNENNANAEENTNNGENPNTEENVNNENNANAEENTNNGENPNTEENVNNENNANAEENTNARENVNFEENANT